MRVQVENIEYRIAFKHRYPGVSGKLLRGVGQQVDRGGTTCIISAIEHLPGGVDNNIGEIAKAELNVYYKDRFDKEKGRKLSLTRALQAGRTGFKSTTYPRTNLSFEDGLFDKATRRAIWDAYLNRNKPTKEDEDVDQNQTYGLTTEEYKALHK